ncbi:HD-GYP domain-containing protein [Lachnospiraceae bacterium LCP25S3_G4]
MKKTVKKDIFDKKGNLLIRCGAEIDWDDRCFQLLESFDAFEEDDINIQQNTEQTIICHLVKTDRSNIIEKSKQFFLSNQGFSMEQVEIITNVMNSIIHNNKDKIWYLHLNTLFNYVDWLYSHSVNVALIAGILALELKYSNQELEDIIIGAMLHDIGMVLIPKEILMKTKPLLKEEANFIKKHCELGYSMVQESNLSEETKLIMLQHHERLDGSGYPNKLQGSQITMPAQIVNIADSFDSATSFRPYKKAKSALELLEELNQSSSYNPFLVKLLSQYFI